MARVKTGPYRHRHHKKILKMAEGQFSARHRLFRTANEAMLKSLWYSYRDRRNRRRDLRRLWIARINAAAREQGMTYSVFMNGLKKANIQVDRKVLSDIAVFDKAAFAQFVVQAKSSLGV